MFDRRPTGVRFARDADPEIIAEAVVTAVGPGR